VNGRIAAAVALLCAFGTGGPTAHAASTDSCGRVTVTCGANADPSAGDFHGMIAATDAGWVLDAAARSGTAAGCGDCVWRVALACPQSSPTDPAGATSCAGLTNPLACPTGQLLYRLYLTTTAFTDQVEGLLCLGGNASVVATGDQARADVARYLKDVTPPMLVVTIAPRRLTLAGLPTYFGASAPSTLRPAEFGGPVVTETITLTVNSERWRWGDGSGTGWVPAASRESHRYEHSGQDQVELTARWGASYTVGYEGRTFGPYDATGQLVRKQSRTERVATSSPDLVARP